MAEAINCSLSGADLDALLAPLRAAGLLPITAISTLSAGLSNHTYKVVTATASYVLRCNTPAADNFCRREHERAYWQLAANATLAPALLWVSPDGRYYLSEFITQEPLLSRRLPNASIAGLGGDSPGALMWSALACQVSAANLLRGQPQRRVISANDVIPPKEAGVLTGSAFTHAYPDQAHELLLALLLRLRDLPQGQNSVSMSEQWLLYQRQLQRLLPRSQSPDAASPEALHRDGELAQFQKLMLTPSCHWQQRARQLLGRQAQISDGLATLAACLIRPQFCHRDLNPHNVLLKDQRLYCIDFEYAAASHPLFDLATVLATHDLTPAQQWFLLQQYLDNHPNLTKDALKAVPAAMDIYWVFACAWALLMAASCTEEARQCEYLGWFDDFWSALSFAI